MNTVIQPSQHVRPDLRFPFGHSGVVQQQAVQSIIAVLAVEHPVPLPQRTTPVTYALLRFSTLPLATLKTAGTRMLGLRLG